MSDDPQLVLCPYCGHTQADDDRCGECGGLFEPLSRRATQIAMGPWYVRDRKRPYHPGCSYEVLKKRIAAGAVRPNSVIRGPTTRQFWSLARNVPGVAHLLGYCHECRAHVDPTSGECSSCGAPFQEIEQRNELGLQFPTRQAAHAAQAKLNAELEQAGAPANAASPATKAGTANTASGDPMAMADNLLGQVITKPGGSSGPGGPRGNTASRQPAPQQRSSPMATSSMDDTPVAPVGQASAPASPPLHAPKVAPQAADETNDEQDSSRGMSTKTLVFILIGLNVIALLVILVMLATAESGSTNNTTPPPTPVPSSDSPTAPGSTPAPSNSSLAPTATPEPAGPVAAVTETESETESEPEQPPEPQTGQPSSPQPTPSDTPRTSAATGSDPAGEATAQAQTDPRRARVAAFFGDGVPAR